MAHRKLPARKLEFSVSDSELKNLSARSPLSKQVDEVKSGVRARRWNKAMELIRSDSGRIMAIRAPLRMANGYRPEGTVSAVPTVRIV